MLRLPVGLPVVLPILVALALPVGAQPIPLGGGFSLDPSGGIQPRVSVAEEDGDVRTGVGLRRARLQARLLYGDVAGIEYDVEAASGVVQSVDLFAFVNPADRVQVRAGYMVAPQPRAHIGTPYFLIDAVDRAVIAERWAARTLGGDGRDLGVDVRYLGEALQLELMVHNGAGSFDRSRGNFSEGLSGGSLLGGPETPGVAVSAAGRWSPGGGVEVGGFAGANGAEAERTVLAGDGRSYATGGAHLYWGAEPGSQPVRLKLDALGIAYEAAGGGEAQRTAGVAALGAVRVLGAGEAFARVERFWDEVDAAGDDYLAAGLSYSPSAARGGPYQRARLTLAYGYRQGAVLPDAHLVVLQGQLVF